MWCRFIIERVAPAAALLGNRAHLTPKLQAMSDADFESLVGRIASADLAARWREDPRRRLSRRRSSRTAAPRSGSRSSGSRSGSTATGSSAPSPSPTSKPMPGSPAWSRSCPRRSTNAPKTLAWLDRVKARRSVRKALALSRDQRPAPGLGAGARNQPLGLRIADESHRLFRPRRRDRPVADRDARRRPAADLRRGAGADQADRGRDGRRRLPAARSRPRSIRPTVSTCCSPCSACGAPMRKWIPVNTRNAIDANAAYLNYVRCGWLFYHSSMADDVAELKARVPTLQQLRLPRQGP